MNSKHFRLNIEAMKTNENYKLITFNKEAVIDAIDSLIRQLNITKEGVSGEPECNYFCKRYVAEWLFMDSKKLDGIIKNLLTGEYDND